MQRPVAMTSSSGTAKRKFIFSVSCRAMARPVAEHLVTCHRKYIVAKGRTSEVTFTASASCCGRWQWGANSAISCAVARGYGKLHGRDIRATDGKVRPADGGSAGHGH